MRYSYRTKIGHLPAEHRTIRPFCVPPVGIGTLLDDAPGVQRTYDVHAKPVPERVGRRMDISRVKKKKQKIPQPQDTTRTAARACVIAV